MFHIILFILAHLVTPLLVHASLGVTPSYIPTAQTLSELPSDFGVGKPLTLGEDLIQKIVKPPVKVEAPSIPEEAPPTEPETEEPEEDSDDERPVDFEEYEGCSG